MLRLAKFIAGNSASWGMGMPTSFATLDNIAATRDRCTRIVSGGIAG